MCGGRRTGPFRLAQGLLYDPSVRRRKPAAQTYSDGTTERDRQQKRKHILPPLNGLAIGGPVLFSRTKSA